MIEKSKFEAHQLTELEATHCYNLAFGENRLSVNIDPSHNGIYIFVNDSDSHINIHNLGNVSISPLESRLQRKKVDEYLKKIGVLKFH